MFSFKKCTEEPRSKLNTNVTEIVWYRLLLLVLNISPDIFDKIINIHHRLQIGCDGNTRCLCSGHSSVTRFPLLMIHLGRASACVATDIGSLLIFSCQLQLHVRVQPDAPIMRVHHNSILAVGIIQGELECLVTL